MSAADESSPSKSQYPEAETSSCEHVPPGERTVCEGLQVDVDKLTTALVELYQTLSPVVQQANELTAAVDEHMTVVGSWVTLMKEGAHSCQEREQQRENDQPTESELD